MVRKLSCVSCGSLKRFPHTFTSTIDVTDRQKGKPDPRKMQYQTTIIAIDHAIDHDGHYCQTYNVLINLE